MRKSQPKARRKKKCKVCHESFRPFTSTQIVCSPTCALEWSRQQAEKRARKQHRVKMASHRADKERIKTRGQLLKEAQAAFNRFIRLRDLGRGCVSCDKPASWSGQWHASHYRSVGAHPEFRFDETNCHKSCATCNGWLSGALLEYRVGLMRRIGEADVLRLEGPAEIPKWSREQIIEIKKTYNAKARDMKKENDNGKIKTDGTNHQPDARSST